MNNFSNYYFDNFSEVTKKLDKKIIERFVNILQKVTPQ